MGEEQFNSCMARVASGDHDALKQIYEAYISYIYQVILGIVSRKEDAEDITSEFFIKLYQTAGNYKPGTGHKGYLATIARNMAIDFVRKNRREVLESFQVNDDETDTTNASEPQSDENIEETVISDISLKEALDKLKPPEKQVVDMKILSDMTFQEIADILKIPLGTVTWRYREAMNKLRRCGFYEES